MKSVFLSYRRHDTAGHAGRISDRLVARLGASRVFMDVEDIQPGQNFPQAIAHTLAKCTHLLVVIGPHWLASLHARADVNEDFVRHEIAAALKGGLTVIPVLVGGATMPQVSELPPEIVGLARCHAVEIRDNRFDDDVARLVDFVAGTRVVRRTYVAIVIGVIALIAAAGWIASSRLATQERTLDGTWLAEVRKAGGPPYRVGLTLSVKGDRLTGVVRYPTGDGAIIDGQVDEDRISFRTMHVPQFASEPAAIVTEATIESDALILRMTDTSGTATGIARRSNNEPRPAVR